MLKQEGVDYLSDMHSICSRRLWKKEKTKKKFCSFQDHLASTTVFAWTRPARSPATVRKDSRGRDAKRTWTSASPIPARTMAPASTTLEPSAASACLVSELLPSFYFESWYFAGNILLRRKISTRRVYTTYVFRRRRENYICREFFFLVLVRH